MWSRCGTTGVQRTISKVVVWRLLPTDVALRKDGAARSDQSTGSTMATGVSVGVLAWRRRMPRVRLAYQP